MSRRIDLYWILESLNLNDVLMMLLRYVFRTSQMSYVLLFLGGLGFYGCLLYRRFVTSNWRCFLKPILQWKINNYYIFWVCVFSLIYPTYEVHDPYHTVTCGLSGFTIFSTLSHKRHIFRKKEVIVHKFYVLTFLTILSEIFLF